MWNARKWLAMRSAFRAVFWKGQWFDSDKHLTAQAERTLIELRYFCRGDQSTFDADPRVHAMLEGRREVWLKIVAMLNLSDEQLLKMKESEDE